MSAPLYSLTAQYQQLLEAAEQGEDVTDALAQLDDAVEAKAVNIVKLVATLEADAVAAGVEERRLAQRRRTAENNADRLRNYLKRCMEVSGITRVKSAQFSIALAPGRPRVEVHNLEALPPELVRVVPEQRAADKAAILRLHQETGETIPGCEVVATTSLRVR